MEKENREKLPILEVQRMTNWQEVRAITRSSAMGEGCKGIRFSVKKLKGKFDKMNLIKG